MSRLLRMLEEGFRGAVVGSAITTLAGFACAFYAVGFKGTFANQFGMGDAVIVFAAVGLVAGVICGLIFPSRRKA